MATLVLAGASIAVSLTAQSDRPPYRDGRSICFPYDPAALRVVENVGNGTWRLQTGYGAIFRLFADREDAEAGLAVAKAHTQLCYIGKDNTRTNRQDYIMHYWK